MRRKEEEDVFDMLRQKEFPEQLEWHMLHGTRPEVAPGDLGKEWTIKDLGEELEHATTRYRSAVRSSPPKAARRQTNKRGSHAARSITDWLTGDHDCAHYPYGLALESVFFGETRPNDPWHRIRLLFREARRAKTRSKSLYIQRPVPKKLRRDITTQIRADAEAQGWQLAFMKHGQGLTSSRLNRELLLNAPIFALRVIPNLWRPTHEHADELTKFVLSTGEGDTKLEQKVRLASEIAAGKDVAIQQTDYHCSLTTDQLAWFCVHTREIKENLEPRQILWDGMSSFVDFSRKGHARLLEFHENGLSNQIGASVLAFTSDGYLMIIYQSKDNRQSADLLAPSGSGSLDWGRDYARSRATDLLTLVRCGAERELREECSLNEYKDRAIKKRRIGSHVIVTGFSKMLHRGGKPEFYCLGWIDAPAKELIGRKPEKYVTAIRSIPGDKADWRHPKPSCEVARVCRAYVKASEVDEEVRIDPSYPLEHGLHLLIEACIDEACSTVIDRFVHNQIKVL
jgi:hypothetical protein